MGPAVSPVVSDVWPSRNSGVQRKMESVRLICIDIPEGRNGGGGWVADKKEQEDSECGPF